MAKTPSPASVARKGQQQPESPPPAPRLDEKIYEISVKTARSIRRFRYTVISILVALVLVVAGLWGFNAYQVSQRRAHAARLAELLRPPPGAESPVVDAILDDLDALLADVRGRPEERWIARETVETLLAEARRRIFPEPEPDGDAGTPPAPRDAGPLLTRVESIVDVTAGDFPDDEDVQSWAESTRRAVASLRNPHGAAGPRPQKPVLPEAPANPPASAPSGKSAPSGDSNPSASPAPEKR